MPEHTPPELDLLRAMEAGRVRDPIDSPVLARCLERGWVEVSGPKGRRVWRVTEEGRSRLK